MPKNDRFGSNAQTKGGGFLSKLPKGECIQLHNDGMTRTDSFDVWTSAIDAPADDPTVYHRPSYGVVSRKQPQKD